MAGPRKLAASAALLLGSLLVMAGRADAFDLNGAWASDADQIIGKFARCRIKTRKDDGMNVNLIAACATDIMLSSVQFSLKQLDANSVARLFPGIEEMEIRYRRCPSP